MWFNLHEWDYVKLVIGLNGYSTQNFVAWSESKDEVDNFYFVLGFIVYSKSSQNLELELLATSTSKWIPRYTPKCFSGDLAGGAHNISQEPWEIFLANACSLQVWPMIDHGVELSSIVKLFEKSQKHLSNVCMAISWS